MWNAVKRGNRVKALPWQDEYAQACDMRICISEKGIIKLRSILQENAKG